MPPPSRRSTTNSHETIAGVTSNPGRERATTASPNGSAPCGRMAAATLGALPCSGSSKAIAWACEPSTPSGAVPATSRSAAARSSDDTNASIARRATAQHRARCSPASTVPPPRSGNDVRRPVAYRSPPNASRPTNQPNRSSAGTTTTSTAGGRSRPANGRRRAASAAIRTLPATNAATLRSRSPSTNSPPSSNRPGRGRTSSPGDSGPSSKSIKAGANVRT